jgi:hypothetical protein
MAKKGTIFMKIDIEKSRVSFSPENAEEKAKIEAIWRILVDCVGDSRKLVPIGEYSPQQGNASASFHIEGLEPQESSYVEVRVDSECEAFCKTCSKVVILKAGDVIPLCCGKMMEVVD